MSEASAVTFTVPGAGWVSGTADTSPTAGAVVSTISKVPPVDAEFPAPSVAVTV